MSEKGSLYRKVVLFLGDNWVETLSILALSLLISTCYNLFKEGGDAVTLGLELLFGGSFLIIFVSWLFFCIIETRQLLEEIAQNTAGQSSSNISEGTRQTLADDERKCPICGYVIKKIAKKCKHCGSWLEEKKEGEN